MRRTLVVALLVVMSLALLRVTGSLWWMAFPFLAVVGVCALILVAFFVSHAIVEPMG